MPYIERTLEPVIRRAVQEFPVVVLTGPRQSGKTTLLRHLFAAGYRYASLDTLDVRAAASDDPRGFLALYPPPVIFDEVQYVPELLSYIKERVDADRGRAGQYILTGSQNLLLARDVTESLAGRAAMLRLLPLTYREMGGVPHTPLPWENGASRKPTAPVYTRLWDSFLQGGYPELAANQGRDRTLWHAKYPTKSFLTQQC